MFYPLYKPKILDICLYVLWNFILLTFSPLYKPKILFSIFSVIIKQSILMRIYVFRLISELTILDI